MSGRTITCSGTPKRLLPVVIALIVAAACSRSTAPLPALCAGAIAPEAAIVTIAWRNTADKMDVLVRGQSTVRAACDYISGISAANIPSGRIAAGAGPADPRVPFRYVPESIQFVEAAIELCDSALLRTPQAVEAFFSGTGSDLAGTAPYCPWGARPVDVRASG